MASLIDRYQAGLALARALRQAGLAPQVIEREPGWGAAGTGIYLPANGVRALRTLGLEGAVAARGTRIPRQRLLDHRGHLLADIDLRQLFPDRPGRPRAGVRLCRRDRRQRAGRRPDRALRQRFAGFAAPVPELLRQLDDPSRVHVAPIEQVAATGWGRGAVVLRITSR